MYRLMFPSELWDRLDAHLRAAAPDEDGAFLLLRTGRGALDTRLLVVDVLLPGEGAWEAQGSHRLRPSGQWLSAVMGEAIESGTGLGFVHSHPDSSHPPRLSPIDRVTSIEWSRLLAPTLQRPFLSLVWTPQHADGWVFEADSPEMPTPVGRIEVLGQGRSRWVHPSAGHAADTDLDDRQIRAIGELGNERLRMLTVAVVGAGGTGSPVAEQLARMGVRRIILIDPDRIDTPSNLRRVVGSVHDDLVQKTEKVEAVARHVQMLGLGSEVDAISLDVRHKSAGIALLDADVVISTTDTHSSRSLVNELAVQYWIPLIDVGVKVGTAQSGVVTGMPADIRIVLPDAGCLWCTGVLDAAMIRAENLPPDERQALAVEGYVQGVGEPQASLAPLNYFAAGLVLLTMLRLLSSDGVLAARTFADGWEHYFADRQAEVTLGCICEAWRGRGDDIAVSYLPTTPAG